MFVCVCVCSNEGVSSNERLRGAASTAQPRQALSIDLLHRWGRLELHNDDCL